MSFFLEGVAAAAMDTERSIVAELTGPLALQGVTRHSLIVQASPLQDISASR